MKKANSRTSWFFWLWVFPAFEPFSSKSSSSSWFRWFRFRVTFYGAEFWALKIQEHQYSKSWLGVSQVHMLASCIHFWTLNSFPCFWGHRGGLGEALGTASTTHEQFWKVSAATRGTWQFEIWVSVRNHKKNGERHQGTYQNYPLPHWNLVHPVNFSGWMKCSAMFLATHQDRNYSLY